ncbi:hypothetical protein BGZ91_003023 [Linnemannia elongata]|nr:hypothetical protein BGZ91_003023 [Linnemannia elongata]
MDYSPGGQRLVLGTDYSSVMLWDLQSDEPDVKLEGHLGPVNCVAYSPCGKWILSGGSDKTVKLWSSEADSWSRAVVITGCAEAGRVSIRMHWGSSIGRLCADDLKFKGAVGLSPIYRKLLVQRGADGKSLSSEEDESLSSGDEAFDGSELEDLVWALKALPYFKKPMYSTIYDDPPE